MVIHSDEDNLLLPSIIDKRAISEPTKIFCVLLKTENVKDGLTIVSYKDYANAINKCAWWFEETLGKGDHRDLKTIAYLGSSDIRQYIVSFAAAKAGYKAMLLSPRNSSQGQLRLLESTDSHILLTAQELSGLDPLVEVLTSKRELNILSFKSIMHWIGQPPAPQYPFQATLAEDANRPCAILHTSGSTGLPEPVTYTFGALASYRNFLEPQKRCPGARPTMVDLWKNKVTYVAFPTFHVVGFMCGTASNIYWGMNPILAPSSVVPTPAFAASIHALEICKSTLLPISVLEPLAYNPQYIEGLRKLEVVIWCGSAFSSSIAPENLHHVVPISSAYGTTEAGPLATQNESLEDYEYMSFSPLVGAHFQHHSDDLYELIIKKEPRLHEAQHIFYSFPELEKWSPKDLFSKHPTKEGLWKYEGRTDEILVLSNGSNINPLYMEGILQAHPKIKAALLTGDRKSRTAWLIEAVNPPGNEEQREELVKEIWGTVEKANEAAHYRDCAKVLSKDMVVFTTKSKPFERAAKGTVQRKSTVRAYNAELESLYQ